MGNPGSVITKYNDISTGVAAGWQLAAGHFEASVFTLEKLFPLADASTNTWARHRNAHPDLKYEIPIAVRGGAWPYRYQLIDDGGATWLSMERETLVVNGTTGVHEWLDGYGVLSGTAPSSGGPWTVTVRVTDQEGTSVDLTWSITLSTGAFVFVDFVSGSDSTGTGTYANPYKTVDAVVTAGTFGTKICVFKGTTYTQQDEPALGGGMQSYSGADLGSFITEDRTTRLTWNATSVSRLGQWRRDDYFVSGFDFVDLGQTDATLSDNVRGFWSDGATRSSTFWSCTLDNPVVGNLGNDNAGFVFLSDPGASFYTSHVMISCDGSNFPSSSNGFFLHDGYNVTHGLIEDCGTTLAAWRFPCWLKDVHQDFTVRANYFKASGDGGCGFGNQGTATKNVEVCYNRLEGASGTLNRALYWNQGNFTIGADNGVIRWYRNNIRWNARNRYNGTGSNGDVSIVACMVAGELQAEVGWTSTDRTQVTGDQVTDPFDSSMNLTGSYRTSYLGTVGAEAK